MGLHVKNLCLSVLGLFLSLSAQAAKPVALILQTRDENRGVFYAQDLKSLLKHQLPGHDVVVVDSWNKDSETTRAQIFTALNDLDHNRIITHLYFLTPTETTQFIPNEGLYKNEITLFGVGSISDYGVDLKFQDTMSPIRDQVSPNAQIIFDACGKTCGAEDFTATTTQGLGEYFKLDNGKVTAILAPNSNTLPVSKGVLIQRKTLVYTVIAGLVTATIATPVVVETATISEFLSTWASFVGASSLFALPVATVTDIVKRTFAEMKKKTVEVHFTDGVPEVKPNSNLSLFGKIGASCKRLVTPNRNRMEGPFP